jgi:hypothetical protein
MENAVGFTSLNANTRISCFCFESLVYCLSIFTATEIYIHVTVRRYRFLFNNQPDALIIQIYSVIKLGQLLCPSSGVLYCTFGIGKFHAGFDDRFQAESGWSSVENS